MVLSLLTNLLLMFVFLLLLLLLLLLLHLLLLHLLLSSSSSSSLFFFFFFFFILLLLLLLSVDFVNHDLAKHFPALVPHVRITLLELLDHILNTYDKRISECIFKLPVSKYVLR